MHRKVSSSGVRSPSEYLARRFDRSARECGEKSKLEPNQKEPKEQKPVIEILTAAEVMGRAQPGWLVKPIIPESGLAMLYGASNVGKTFVVLSLARAIATGEPWLGQYEVQPGEVLYVAAEGGGRLGKRLDALDFAGTGARSRFVLTPVYLAEKANREALLEKLAQSGMESLKLVVVDTLAMSFTGEENSAKEMGELINGAREVRNATGATILFVHHTGKSGDVERGSSALMGAVDAALFLEGPRGQLRLSCTKQKDAECFRPIGLLLTPQRDSQTVQLDSLRTSGVGPSNHLSPVELTALRALRDGAGVAGLRNGEWQRASGLASSTFDKARKSLVEKGFVERLGTNGYVVTAVGGASIIPATPLKLSA